MKLVRCEQVLLRVFDIQELGLVYCTDTFFLSFRGGTSLGPAEGALGLTHFGLLPQIARQVPNNYRFGVTVFRHKGHVCI